MRNRSPIRGPYIVLAGIIVIAVVVGILEQRPTIKEDFDSSRDAAFADTWDQRVHISYWEKWGSFEREACQTMVDAFNKSQDEIFVHYVNTSQVDRKAMLAIMGHDPPDVVGLWVTNVPSFSAAGALLDLEELMASAGLDKDRYIPNYLKLGMYNERVYALPTTPSKEPPPNFREGHPNLEVGIFEKHAASPYTFIQPRLRVWNEYSHEMDKTFEHVWNWPVPEEEHTGLTGDVRQQKVDDLCRAEIKRTLQAVRERMQRQYDNMRERDNMRLEEVVADTAE